MKYNWINLDYLANQASKKTEGGGEGVKRKISRYWSKADPWKRQTPQNSPIILVAITIRKVQAKA